MSAESPARLNAGRDAAWLAEIKAGGPGARAALRDLVMNYHAELMRLIGSRLELSAEDAGDVIQDLWIELPGIAKDFNPERGPALFWLAGVARNRGKRRLVENARRAGREVPLADPDEGEEDEGAAVSQLLKALVGLSPGTPEAAQEASQQQRCVRERYEEFKRLHPDHALVLYMRHVHRLENDEVASFRAAECRRTCKRDPCDPCKRSSVGAARSYLCEARSLFKPLLARCM